MKQLLLVFLLVISHVQINGQKTQNLCAASKIGFNSLLLKPSQVQYPGDETIDVTYARLNLKINYSIRQLNGDVIINAKSKVSNLTDFFLDLQNAFTVDSILSNGSSLTFTHSDNKLFITLPKTYLLDEIFSVDVFYHGRPGSSGFGSFEFGTHNGEPAIWSLSEPYGSSDWWPCKDTPADKFDSSDVWITAGRQFYTVSNGALEEIIDNGDGTKTFKWKNHYPIAQYLISVAMANYSVYKNDFVYGVSDTMHIIHYIYPEHLTSSVRAQLDKTVNMLEVFSDIFGIYPYVKEKYGHAEFGWGGGMEHQTITSLGTDPNSPSFSRDLISHELAHQWFGDKVTCKDWHHIWLNEGFATYLEALYIEKINGKEAYKNKINSEMGSTDKWWTAKGAVGTIWVQDISSVNQIFNSGRSYAKGAVVLHMLRGIVGDSTFFNILKTYLNDPDLAYNVATTEDFQRVAEDVSGQDLNYFFREWIYGEDYPVYSFNWGYSKISDQQYIFKFKVTQSKHKIPLFFTMPIQVKVTTTVGDTLLTFFNNQQKQNFSVEIQGEPQSVSIDPDNLILKDVQQITTNIESKIYLPNGFVLKQNYPNPFNPTTTIEYSFPFVVGDENVRPLQLKIYDLLGREVKTLVNKKQSPGNYTVKFNANGLPSGIYFYKLTSGKYSKVRKMILLK